MASVENEVVRRILERSGEEALPVVLVDGWLALTGRYPTRSELARWAGLPQPAREFRITPAASCCGGEERGT
ncbi:arsenic metallochaperone ArsD family protein [Thioalkalivibrio nitratireducens]|nr:arsenic metallochaperone ArsD family protein [Thioalkalivibrio nitratireducens]